MGRVSRLTSEQVKDIRESEEQLKVLADRHKIAISYACMIRSENRLTQEAK